MTHPSDCHHSTKDLMVTRAVQSESDPVVFEVCLRCMKCGSRLIGYLGNMNDPDMPTCAVSPMSEIVTVTNHTKSRPRKEL